MYNKFYKIQGIVELLSTYLDYAHPCMQKLFMLGNNSVKYDKCSSKATIVIGNDTYLITDKSLLPYILYEYYVSNYDNVFDDSLDFYHTFLSVCGISFKDMVSNLSSIVDFRSNFGYKTEDSDIEFLKEYFSFIHKQLCELDSL